MRNAISELEDERITVLHYVGYDDDRSGIASVVRSLAASGRFDCLLGVNPGFRQDRRPRLATIELSRLAGESIGPATFWRARQVARQVRAWLEGDPRRIFHGHSRAGLLVALWLHWSGERRVVVTVHCYGRQRWFYRWAAGRLGRRLFWLTPAMKMYYHIGPRTWGGCIPNGLPENQPAIHKSIRVAGRLTVGGMGMLVRWKGWHLMIEALALLPVAVQAKIEFRHIGTTDGSLESIAYARELVELARRRGVAEQVHWLGWQPSPAPLLAEVDCLLVASDHEPFSMAALEALFAGVPVLAADSGGPTDFIVAGQNGWLFRTGEARDLARALMDLAQAAAPAAAVRIDAEDLRRFTIAEVAPQWLDVYERALAFE